mmetsp:Transcript_31157/g.65679  ORF Transcript_31157/g.65679 Transcript_31157/m.65679 type:complete len:255 (-) Transcript_31157:612-1376(-)
MRTAGSGWPGAGSGSPRKAAGTETARPSAEAGTVHRPAGTETADWPVGTHTAHWPARSEAALWPAVIAEARMLARTEAAGRSVRTDVRAQRTSGASSVFEHARCNLRRHTAARRRGQSRSLEDQRVLRYHSPDTRTVCPRRAMRRTARRQHGPRGHSRDAGSAGSHHAWYREGYQQLPSSSTPDGCIADRRRGSCTRQVSLPESVGCSPHARTVSRAGACADGKTGNLALRSQRCRSQSPRRGKTHLRIESRRR